MTYSLLKIIYGIQQIHILSTILYSRFHVTLQFFTFLYLILRTQPTNIKKNVKDCSNNQCIIACECVYLYFVYTSVCMGVCECVCV